MIFFLLEYIAILFLSSICCVSIIFSKKRLSKYGLNYLTSQKIHSDYTPPYGGLVIFFLFFSFILIKNPESIFINFEIIFPAILILIIGAFEDTFNNVKPMLRLLIIFVSSLIFVYNFRGNLPTLDIIFLDKLFKEYVYLEIIFYSIGLTALSNGFNMIDGMNGLAGFTALSILLGLSSILFLINNFFTYEVEILVLAFALIGFLILNFPFGKIFLGDAGAYCLGWILGVFVIVIFSNNEINTWGAVLILFYPLMEVIFSTIRKFLQKKNPMYPDIEHLHLKLYFTLKGPIERSKEFNSFTTLTLMPLWFTPSVMIIWTNFYSHLAILSLIVMTTIYLYYYLVVPSK